MTDQGDYSTYASEKFVESCALIGKRLHALGLTVTALAENGPSLNIRDMQVDHARLASDVVHRVMWGVANLNLGDLVRDAGSADRATVEAAQ